MSEKPDGLPPPEPRHARYRTLGIGAGVLVGTILLGAIIGEVIAGDPPAPSRELATSRLQAIGVGDLLLAPAADPEPLEKTRGMGSKRAGISLIAVSQVDRVKDGDALRRAPDGGRLLAFRVGDWVCELQPCENWTSLGALIDVDGSTQPLPEGGDTFVVVLPPGSQDVDLVIEADGFEQSLSLIDPVEDGDRNIALLAARDTEKRVRLAQNFQLSERTSIPLDDGTGTPTDSFVRDVNVVYAQRRFFLDGAVPVGPSKAFLIVNAFYAYLGRDGQNVFGLDEARFVADDGTEYPARDLDPAPETGLLGFEIPARLTGGTFVIGGTVDRISTTGVSYTSTLAERRVRIDVAP